MISGVITDASHANEDEVIQLEDVESGETIEVVEPHRSQGGRLLTLMSHDIADRESCYFHLIGFNSSIIRRVCRATVQAEAYTLQAGVEEGDRIRATIADLRGHLDPKHWEASGAASMRQIWFTDCKSVQTCLTCPTMNKMTDKRLSIEIASMRQDLWRMPGQKAGNSYVQDERPKYPTDDIRWIDTDVMLADPLTKVMEPVKLLEALESNFWDTQQPLESVIKKRAKQLARRKTVDPPPEDVSRDQQDSDIPTGHSPDD